MDLRPYLEDLERRIDPEAEEALEGEWLHFSNGDLKKGCFFPSRNPVPPSIEWPCIAINDAIEDIDLMVLSQLRMCSDALAEGTGELLNVRSNYGTGILPTAFGAEVFMMDRAHDTLPGTLPLPGGKDDIMRIVREGKMDFTRGFAGRVFSAAHCYAEWAAPYERISRFVHYCNPDLQGPLALCEAMWGSDIYYEFYDDPDAVCEALDFMTEAYIDFTRKWKALYPDFDTGHAIEWGLLHKGGTIIRNDAAMNLSGAFYEAYVLPRDNRILAEFGGGVHFCGRGDHYIQHVGGIPGLSVVNLSQPECNDMETVYRHTVDRGILIIGLPSGEVRRAMSADRVLHGRVHSGASLAAWLDKSAR